MERKNTFMWRLEGPNGVGPFRNGSIKENFGRWEVHTDDEIFCWDAFSDDRKLPSPEKDFSKIDDPDICSAMIYGVLCRELLHTWFDDEILLGLALLGYKIVKYKVVDYEYFHYSFSEIQVRALHSAIEFVSIEDIV